MAYLLKFFNLLTPMTGNCPPRCFRVTHRLYAMTGNRPPLNTKGLWGTICTGTSVQSKCLNFFLWFLLKRCKYCMTISGSQLSSTLILDPTRTYWPKLGSLFALYNFVFHIEISQTVAPLTMLFGNVCSW